MVDRIEKLAQYVAQSNGAMEDNQREAPRTNPLFAFLKQVSDITKSARKYLYE